MKRWAWIAGLVVSVGVHAADGCGPQLGDDPSARAVVAGLEADWTLADEALDLVASITRSMHAMDRMLGRPPQGQGDVAARAEFSTMLLRREWEHLHGLTPALRAACLAEAEGGPPAPAAMRDALASAHLDLADYLARPDALARLTDRWMPR